MGGYLFKNKLLKKIKITNTNATNACGSLKIYVIAIVNIVPIKFKIIAILVILLIFTLSDARLYNPMKI